jgi:CRP-like cAMP-binding protein
MEQALLFLDDIELLHENMRNFLTSSLKTIRPAKDAYLLREGEIANRLGFIEKGLLRGFRTTKTGKESTSWITKEGDIFASIRSLFKQVPSRETIQTLEPCIIHTLAIDKLLVAFKQPSFQKHRAVILEKYYIQSVEREDMRQEQAFERLCFLMEYYPDLVGRVPDKYLASFLNLTPTYFSHLKSKYKNGGRRRR